MATPAGPAGTHPEAAGIRGDDWVVVACAILSFAGILNIVDGALAIGGSHVYASNAVGAALGAFAGGLLHDLTGGYRAGLGMAIVLMLLAAMPFWVVPTLRNYR